MKLLIIDGDQHPVIDITAVAKEFTVLCAANYHSKLPLLNGKPYGTRVPIFRNSADFELVSQLTTVLLLCPEVSLVACCSRDQGLVRAIQRLTKNSNAKYRRFKTFSHFYSAFY